MRYWQDLTMQDFEALDCRNMVLILPVAAVEQHGPHLPLSTDVDIMQGFLDALAHKQLENVLCLPVQHIGASDEHGGFKGTLTLPAEILLATWTHLIAQAADLGFQKLIVMSSHGGNSEIASLLARRARTQYQMIAVSSNWLRFLDGADLGDIDAKKDIHAGAIETSIMMVFRPDAIRESKIAALDSNLQGQYQQDHETGLSIHRPAPLAWSSHDLNAQGVLGTPSLATHAMGLALVTHITNEVLKLLANIERACPEDLLNI